MDFNEFKISVVKLVEESKKEEIEKLEKRIREIKKVYRIKKRKLEMEARKEENNKSVDNVKEEQKKDIVPEEVKQVLEINKQNNSDEPKIQAKNDTNFTEKISSQKFRAPGGNPINPQVLIQKQAEADKSKLSTPLVEDQNKELIPEQSSQQTTNSEPKADISIDKTKEESNKLPIDPKPDKISDRPELVALQKEKNRVEEQISLLQKDLQNPQLIKEEAVKHVIHIRKYIVFL